MYEHVLCNAYKNNKSNIRPHVKWVIRLTTAHGHSLPEGNSQLQKLAESRHAYFSVRLSRQNSKVSLGAFKVYVMRRTYVLSYHIHNIARYPLFMPPLHRDTGVLGVVPCGKEIWTRPHGTTRGEKRHTGTPRVS